MVFHLTYRTIIHSYPHKKSEDFSLVIFCFPITFPQVGWLRWLHFAITASPWETKQKNPSHRLLNWGWVGCQQPGGKQVFGTFDHVALPLDFCFPGFVSTEGPRKLDQLKIRGIYAVLFWHHVLLFLVEGL